MNSFSNNIVFYLSMRNRGSNVIFDTCIRYDEDSFRTIKEILVDINKFLS